LLLAGCAPPLGDGLELRPARLELPVDHDEVLVVAARERGKAVLPSTITYESEHPAIARAAPGARVEAVTVGTTRIVAHWGQRTSRVTITVVPEYRQEEGRSWGSDGWVEVGVYLQEILEGGRLGDQVATPGTRLVWLHAWVQNRLRSSHRPAIETFALRDVNGGSRPRSRGPGVQALPRDFPTAELGPFEYGFGWLLFEVPATARLATLEYRDGTIATLRVPLTPPRR
jgi:hypothetical protein